MNARTYVEIAAAVVALGSAAGWLHSRDSRMRAEGRIEIMEQTADSLRAIADSTVQAAAERDSVAVRQIRQADSVAQAQAQARAAAEQRAQDAARRVQQATAQARRATADDTVASEAVDSLVAAHEAETAELREANERADSIIVALHLRIDATEDQLAAQREVTASLRRALEAREAVGEMGSSGPGFVERWGSRVLWAAGGAAVGYLAGR